MVDWSSSYEPGDYVKVEFRDEAGIGEWMWMRVHHRDDVKQIVFGRLITSR
jgi:hypothetical protein